MCNVVVTVVVCMCSALSLAPIAMCLLLLVCSLSFSCYVKRSGSFGLCYTINEHLHANVLVHEQIDTIKRKSERNCNDRQHGHERTPSVTKNYLQIELISGERRRLEAERRSERDHLYRTKYPKFSYKSWKTDSIHHD